MVLWLFKGCKKVIIRSFIFNIKYILWIAMTCLFSAYLFSAYCIVQETNTYNEVENIKTDYGSYTYKLCGIEDKELKIIENDQNTESYLAIKVKSIENSGDLFDYMVITEDFFEYSNYSIVEGRFPRNKDEIMVPKWYLFQLGIDVEDMVGSEIDIKNPNTDIIEKKRVSGLVVINDDNTSLQGVDNSNFFIFGSEYVNFDETINNVYIITSNLNNYEENLKELLSSIYDINENNVEYQINYTLLYACGYTNEGKLIRQQQEYIYVSIVLLIILCVGIILNNALTVCLLKWKSVLGVYKIIGADMLQIRNNILLLFLFVTNMSTILGALMGSVSIYIYGYMNDLKEVIPFGWLMVELVLINFVIVILLIIKLNKYTINTTQNIIFDNRCRTHNKLNQKVLFCNERMGIIKFAFRNFLFYKRKKVISIFSIAICILVLFSISFQFQKSINTTDNNDDFAYYFQVEDYYNVAINTSEFEIQGLINTYNQIELLCRENNCTIYYANEYITKFDLLKKNLGNDYITALKSTASGAVELMNSSNYIKVDVAIMGYSEEMIEELAVNKDKELKALKSGEAIVLTRTTNKDGNGGNHFLSMVGEKFNLETLLFDEKLQDWKINSYNIVEEVNDLSVYPQYRDNSLCVIIDIDEYNKSFNNGYISSFYLKDIDGIVLNKIQRILEGNTYIKIKNLKDEASAVKSGYIRRMILLMVILGMCCFLVVVNIQVQNIFEFDYRKSEFELLQIIGISKKKKYAIVILETTYVFLLGIIGGLVLCKVMEYILYNLGILYTNNMSNIVAGGTIIVTFMIFSICLTCKTMKGES